jgi:putative membrane protein
MLEQTFNGMIHFAIYFGLALVALIIFKVVYTLITPHDEWDLIKNQKNTAAAIGFGGGIIGFSLALSGAISNSISLIDFGIWAVVALVAQSVAFALVRFMFMPRIVKRIEDGEISAGIMLATVNISVGLLNAACMTY